MSKRDEFIRKMKDRLDEWNLEIDGFEEKIRKIKTDMKDKYQTQIDELRKKRREGDRKLEQIRTAGEDTVGAFESRKRTCLERNEGCARGLQVTLPERQRLLQTFRRTQEMRTEE